MVRQRDRLQAFDDEPESEYEGNDDLNSSPRSATLKKLWMIDWIRGLKLGLFYTAVRQLIE
jgi:hypothetical protein